MATLLVGAAGPLQVGADDPVGSGVDDQVECRTVARQFGRAHVPHDRLDLGVGADVAQPLREHRCFRLADVGIGVRLAHEHAVTDGATVDHDHMAGAAAHTHLRHRCSERPGAQHKDTLAVKPLR